MPQAWQDRLVLLGTRGVGALLDRQAVVSMLKGTGRLGSGRLGMGA